MTTDLYLLQWIKDQDYNLEAAENKLRKSIQSRKQNKVDELKGHDFSDIARHCPFDLTGEDNEGRPLWIFYAGRCDVRRLVLTGNEERLYQFVHQTIDFVADKVSRKQLNGENVSQFVAIGDVNGFNWRQHGCLKCITFIPNAINILNDNYPQHVNAVYFVNVPRIFYAFFDLMEPLLPEALTKILKMYGHDQNEWRQVLAQSIKPDQLPKYFGGTRQSQLTTITG